MTAYATMPYTDRPCDAMLRKHHVWLLMRAGLSCINTLDCK